MSAGHTVLVAGHVVLSFRKRGVMVVRSTPCRRSALVPLILCFSFQGAPALGGLEAFLQSPPIFCGETPIRRPSKRTSSSTRRDLWIACGSDDGWKLRSSPGSTDESSGEEIEDDGSSSSLPDTIGQNAPLGVPAEKWARVLQSARDKKTEDDRLSPSPQHKPSHVAAVTLQALRRNDEPYPNFGCEIAIRFSSASNPASDFTPGGMRTYIDDPSMPFYRILGDWDEMGPVEDAEIDAAETGKANQQIRVKQGGDSEWSTVSMDFVREGGCWLIERLWIDDKSVAGGGRAGKGDESLPPPRLSVAELFDEDRLEVMSCKYADYDPASLLTAGGDWLEERPNPSLSPKAVALTCIISLRQNNDGSSSPDSTSSSIGDDEDGDTSRGNGAAPPPSSAAAAAAAAKLPLNQGCERVIRFCSPNNVASTLTPAHFAQYLNEPWYAIFKEWDELSFHSEDISDDGGTADLVVLLRPEHEEAWTSVNWELVLCDGMWLTERIWVVDV